MAGSDSTINTSRDLPEPFNHKEVGYPVTETQHRAKSPFVYVSFIINTFLFSLCAWC